MTQPKLDTLQTIELAEGVRILLRPAGPIPRAMALVVDLLIMVFVLVPLLLLLIYLLRQFSEVLDFEFSLGVLALGFFLIYWGYFIFLEVLWKGQTFGKRIFKLRVVTTAGTKVGWSAAIARNLIRFADMQPFFPLGGGLFGFYFVGAASCLSTRRFQRLGDLVADTLVIYAWQPEIGKMAKTWIKAPAMRQPVTPEAPSIPLTREEQQAFIEYFDRSTTWSDARNEEMVAPLAALLGVDRRQAVRKALAIGAWLRNS